MKCAGNIPMGGFDHEAHVLQGENHIPGKKPVIIHSFSFPSPSSR